MLSRYRPGVWGDGIRSAQLNFPKSPSSSEAHGLQDLERAQLHSVALKVRVGRGLILPQLGVLDPDREGSCLVDNASSCFWLVLLCAMLERIRRGGSRGGYGRLILSSGPGC